MDSSWLLVSVSEQTIGPRLSRASWFLGGFIWSSILLWILHFWHFFLWVWIHWGFSTRLNFPLGIFFHPCQCQGPENWFILLTFIAILQFIRVFTGFRNLGMIQIYHISICSPIPPRWRSSMITSWFFLSIAFIFQFFCLLCYLFFINLAFSSRSQAILFEPQLLYPIFIWYLSFTILVVKP